MDVSETASTADISLCPGTSASEAVGGATRAGYTATSSTLSSTSDSRRHPPATLPAPQRPGGEAVLLSSVRLTDRTVGTPEAMATRIAELEAMLEAVRAAVGVSSAHLSVAASSPTVPLEPTAPEVEGVEGQLPGDDGQLTVGDEPGRSTFYGSAATHYLIVSACTGIADTRDERRRTCGSSRHS